MSASPAFKIVPGSAQSWRSDFLGIKLSTSPCYGLAGPKWDMVRVAALDFLDLHADAAEALGWTTLDLFGVHPDLGIIRADYCGAMMLSGQKVSRVEPTYIAFQNLTYHRNIPGRPEGAVPIWTVKR